MHGCVLSCVWIFVTLWTVQPTRLLHSWKFPGKNIGAGCHLLLQGIFSIQGLNPGLLHFLHCQADSLPVSSLESPPSKYILLIQCPKSKTPLLAPFKKFLALTQYLAPSWPLVIVSLIQFSFYREKRPKVIHNGRKQVDLIDKTS